MAVKCVKEIQETVIKPWEKLQASEGVPLFASLANILPRIKMMNNRIQSSQDFGVLDQYPGAKYLLVEAHIARVETIMKSLHQLL